MEDELEDRVLYQTYSSHMKLLSRVSLGAGAALDAPTAFCWRLMRLYILRTETVVFALALLAFLVYLQTVELWSRALLSRLAHAVGSGESNRRIKLMSGGDEQSWRLRGELSAAYAIRGRRMHMEDRFIINENINDTGVSLFAIFDGHGGEFAANYAKDHLVQNLHNKIVELCAYKEGKLPAQLVTPDAEEAKPNEPEAQTNVERKKSFRKSASTAEDSAGKGVTDPLLLAQLARARPIVTRDVRPSTEPIKTINIPLSSYLDKGKINFGKLLTDEVLAADRLLVEAAKRSLNVAGTTALIAIMEGNHIIVANVGDSRGVMCDLRGNAIPLSFDHKPQQVREQKRIEAAGGYIAFNGVWRVAGILATSRAMGDYPLKDKKFVIADPDILTFDLDDHKPLFVILASDGLWDTFTNEEAIKFVKERLDESDFGAKSLTLQAYYRGSVDNITVLIINFVQNKVAIATVNK